MARRIQRKRTKGWRLRQAVYVGRPTKWGNPYRVGVDGSAAECVEKYRHKLVTTIWSPVMGGITPKDVKRDLRGFDLVCWCPLDQPCHADVLLEIANS